MGKEKNIAKKKIFNNLGFILNHKLFTGRQLYKWRKHWKLWILIFDELKN